MADTYHVVRTALEHFRAERFDQSADLLRRALQKDPRHPGANQLYALTLLAQNKLEAAIFCIGRAIEAMPLHAEFHANLGLIKSATADKRGAEAAFRRALQLEATHPDAGSRLAQLLADRGAQDEAEDVLRVALRADPLSIPAASMMAKVLSDMGRSDEAAALLRDVLARAAGAGRRADAAAIDLLCLLTNYIEPQPAAVMETHTRFGRYVDAAVPQAERRPYQARAAGGRIRIGYLSPDLRRHSVTSFLEPLLATHSRSRFEVFVYSIGSHVDDVTRRLESLAEHWRAIGPLQDGPVLEVVRRDGLDILIELSGHTMNNRLVMLARRAAPVQVSFLGYPATTGSPGIDVRLVDATTDPEGADLYATERLVRLPGCFLCFQPPDDAPAVSPPPQRGDAPVTFGSFNNPAKISEVTMDLWARVLGAAPGSRLILKGSSLGLASVREQFAARFAARGIDPARLEQVGTIADPREHLAAYGRIDIGLDTTPYNGTTTTCEALWMGVPVVSLLGRTHAARVGASVLTAAGLPELVAATPEVYVECAAGLARDPARRHELRRTLRARLSSSALCDRAAYTAAFECTIEGLAHGPRGRG